MAQTFRQALVAQLNAIPEITAIVGSSIYPFSVPETHDLSRNGPALTYIVDSNPRGQLLQQADGLSMARVTFRVWSYFLSQSDQVTNALFNAINGPPGAWGDGTCSIVSVTQQDESDEDIPPKTGTDQWIYAIDSEYLIKYRVAIPTLT